jgi:DNA-binding NtrC family response regulator
MTVNGKILVVDDHIALAENLAEVLESAGYEAAVADSAEAALVRLDIGDIGALITDFKLPGRNGAELITELRRRGSHIPAVVMSAFTDDDTLERARSAGALDVLAKPLDFPQFFAVVEEMGNEESVILVVDDNRQLAENLAEILQQQGHLTRIGGSVSEALAALPRPRAAIVDFVLPDGTGLDVAERLRARDPRVQLLFVSGHAERLRQEVGGPLAAITSLEKPVNLDRLLEWVVKAVDRRG